MDLRSNDFSRAFTVQKRLKSPLPVASSLILNHYQKMNNTELTTSLEQNEIKRQKAIKELIGELSGTILLLEDNLRRVSKNYVDLMGDHL